MFPNKEFKEAWTRLEWQEDAVKDISVVTGDNSSWSYDHHLHLSVVPMVAQAAVNKLISLCVDESVKEQRDASCAKAMLSRLMGRLASLAAAAMTPTTGGRAQLYIDGLFRLVENNGLSFRALMNDFTALAATRARNLGLLISIFVKRALQSIQSGAIKAEADQVCYLLERLVVADRSLAEAIWADLVDAFQSSLYGTSADAFLMNFYLEQLLPLAVRERKSFPHVYAGVTSFLSSGKAPPQLLRSCIKLSYFQCILSAGPNELARVCDSLLDSLMTLNDLTLRLECEFRIVYLVIEVLDFADPQTISPLLRLTRNRLLPLLAKGQYECRPVVGSIVTLLTMRIADGAIRHQLPEADAIQAIEVLTELLRIQEVGQTHTCRETMCAGIVRTICEFLRQQFPTSAVLEAIIRLEEYTGVNGDFGNLEPLSVAENPLDDWFAVWGTHSPFAEVGVLCDLMRLFSDLFKEEMGNSQCAWHVLTPQSGAPFTPLLRTLMSALLLRHKDRQSSLCSSVLHQMRLWTSTAPYPADLEGALPVSANRPSPAVYAMAEIAPILHRRAVETGDVLSLIVLTSLSRDRQLAPTIFKLMTTACASITSNSAYIGENLEPLMATRLLYQGGLPYTKFFGCISGSPGEVQFLLEAAEVEPVSVYSTFQRTLLTRLWKNELSQLNRCFALRLAARLLEVGAAQPKDFFDILVTRPGLGWLSAIKDPAGVRQCSRLLAEFIELNAVPRLLNAVQNQPLPIDDGEWIEEDVLKSLIPWLNSSWAASPATVIDTLLPLLLHTHRLALGDASEDPAGVFLAQPAYHGAYSVLETPADLLRLLNHKELRISEMTASSLGAILEVHRGAIGHRIRKVGNVNHPLIGMSSRTLHPRFALSPPKELIPLGEMVLYSPPVTTGDHPGAGAAERAERFKAMLKRIIFGSATSAPINLNDTRDNTNAPAQWESCILVWYISIQHLWRPLFSRYLAACTMTNVTEAAWDLYNYLTGFLWDTVRSPGGKAEPKETVISPTKNMDGLIKIFLACGGLALAAASVASHVAGRLLDYMQGALRNIASPDDMSSESAMTSGFVFGASSIVLSALHFVNGVADYANTCFDAAVKHGGLRRPVVQAICSITNRLVPAVSEREPPPRRLILAASCFGIASEAATRSFTQPAEAGAIRDALLQIAEDSGAPLQYLILAFADLHLLNATVDRALLRKIAATTSRLISQPLAAIWVASLLPRLTQLGYSTAETIEKAMDDLAEITYAQQWTYWARCALIGGAIALDVNDREKVRRLALQQMAALFEINLGGLGVDSEKICAIMGAFSLLGIQTFLPSLLQQPGDLKNHLQQPIQIFFTMAKVPVGESRGLAGKSVIQWLSQTRKSFSVRGSDAGGSVSGEADGTKVSMQNMSPLGIIFMGVLHQALRCYRDPSLTLESLAQSNLIRWSLLQIRADSDCGIDERIKLLSLLANISVLPDLNLRQILAPLAEKYINEHIANPNDRRVEDAILAVWRFCIAHCPKDNSLASLLSDVGLAFWSQPLSRRLRLQFVLLSVLPLALVLPPRDWLASLLRTCRETESPPGVGLYEIVVLRQLTSLTLLARHAVRNEDDNVVSRTLRENATAHLVPNAWHQTLKRTMVAVDDGESGPQSVVAQTQMSLYANLARKVITECVGGILKFVVYPIMQDFAGNDAVAGATAMLVAQLQMLKLKSGESVMRHFWEIQDGSFSAIRNLPPAALVYLHLLKLTEVELIHRKMEDLLTEGGAEGLWKRKCHQLVTCLGRLSRKKQLGLLQTCLYLCIKSGDISRERTAYMAALMIYKVTAAFGAVLQSVNIETLAETVDEEYSKLFRDQPLLLTTEQCHRWDFLFHTGEGVDALLQRIDRTSRTQNFWHFSAGGAVVVEDVGVCECPPIFLGLDAFLNSVADPIRAEPQDQVLATAADAQQYESARAKLSRLLLLETLEERHLKLHATGVFCQEDPFAIDTSRALLCLQQLKERCPEEFKDIVIEVAVRYERFLESLHSA